MLDPIFKGRQYPPDTILWTVRWYCRYPLVYRMLKERGVDVDHATIARWMAVYGPEIEKRLRDSSPKSPVPGVWMRPV